MQNNKKNTANKKTRNQPNTKTNKQQPNKQKEKKNQPHNKSEACYLMMLMTQLISEKVHATVCTRAHNKFLGLRDAALTSVCTRTYSRINQWSDRAFRQCNVQFYYCNINKKGLNQICYFQHSWWDNIALPAILTELVQTKPCRMPAVRNGNISFASLINIRSIKLLFLYTA